MARDRRFEMRGLDDKPEEARLVGMIVARWSLVESSLMHLLPHLLGGDPWQAKLVASSLLNSKARLGMLAAAGRFALRGDDLLDQFDRLMDEAERRAKARNRLAHGVFATDERGRLVIMNESFDWDDLIQDPESQRVATPVSVASLVEELGALAALHDWTSKFLRKLFDTAPTLPDGSPVPSPAWLRRARARTPPDPPTSGSGRGSEERTARRPRPSRK